MCFREVSRRKRNHSLKLLTSWAKIFWSSKIMLEKKMERKKSCECRTVRCVDAEVFCFHKCQMIGLDLLFEKYYHMIYTSKYQRVYEDKVSQTEAFPK